MDEISETILINKEFFLQTVNNANKKQISFERGTHVAHSKF